MRKKLIVLILILASEVFSQNITGAFMTAKLVSGFTYSISVELFTDVSIPINRPSVSVGFGNGASANFSLGGIRTENGTQISTYSGQYTYSNAGLYKVYYIDSFRVASIKNISNSQTQSIYAETFIRVNNLINPMSSLVVSNYPTNFNVSGNQVSYNPACVDPDGDSLSYSFINCYGSNYYLPSNAAINYTNGTITFSKDSIGIYAFKFEIKKWRNSTNQQKVVIGISEMDFVMDITPTIGIKETGSLNSINIYPNPFTHYVFLTTGPKIFTQSYIFVLRNVYGIEVASQLINKNINSIDLHYLPKGVYFADMIKNGQSVYKTKLIKE